MAEVQEQRFYRVQEVAKMYDCSEAHAYKIIRQLNAEMKKKGMITVAGRISKKYFDEKSYMA